MVSQEEDADLIGAVRRGDDQAFERLYARYHRRISAYVRGMVKDHARAEDVTQEVFISALRRLRASDQEIVLRPWLYEIARNACIDQYRRTQRAPEVLLDTDSPETGPLVSIGPTPDVAVDTKQTLDHLRHAFSGLSEVQHEVLVMRELEGRSYREIGDRLNLTRPAVESALFRARRRLLEEYEDLSSGSRCVRVQRAITSACTGSAGVRERWRIASHVSHCNVCRHHARLSGLGPELVSGSVPAKVAAVLPLPAFLRRALSSRAPRGGVVHPDHVSGLMNVAGAVSTGVDPLSGLITAGAAAATVALAIGGASVIGTNPAPRPAPTRPAAAAHVAKPSSAAQLAAARRAARIAPPAFSLAAGGGRSFGRGSTGGTFHTGSAPAATSRPTHTAGRQSGLPDLTRHGGSSSGGSSSGGSSVPLHRHVGRTVTETAAGVTGAAGRAGGTTAAGAIHTAASTPAGAAAGPVDKAVQGLAGDASPPPPPSIGH